MFDVKKVSIELAGKSCMAMVVFADVPLTGLVTTWSLDEADADEVKEVKGRSRGRSSISPLHLTICYSAVIN